MNRKVLSTATKELNKAKAPAKPKDIFFDPSGMGMLNPNYAGKPVRLATDTLYNPTKYKIRAYADNGVSAKLNPYDTTDVTLEGAKYIDEYPEMQNGGIYMDGDLSQEEIDYYAKGGYVIEDISIPQLTQAQNGLTKKSLAIADPKEHAYRKKAYDDSLNLYNFTNNRHLEAISGGGKLKEINDPDIKRFLKESAGLGVARVLNADPNIRPNKFYNYIYPNGEFGGGSMSYEKPKQPIGKVIRKPGDAKYAAYKKEGGGLLTKKVTCKSCGWKWDAADGGDDITTCHKCGGQGLIHAQKGVQVNKKSTRNPALEEYMNRDMSQAYQIKDVPSETIQATANQKPKLSQNVNSKKDILGDIQKEKEAFAIRQSKDQIKEGTGPREAQSISGKLKDIVLNPMTAAGYAIRGQAIPDYLQESLDNGTYGYWANGVWHTERNPLDNVTDLSPIGLIHDASDTYEGIKNKDINQAGLGLLGFIPGVSEARKAKKVINSVDDELLDAYNLAIDLKRQGKISHLPDSPEGFDTWLQSQYNQKPIYRVVDVNKNVVNDQLIKNNMIKQGLDPNNEYHIAEYMGTSVAPAEVINRGRRSGGHDELLKGTNKDILYFAEDPTWIGPRYGGDNPYYIKTFADETPTGYKNQVLGLRPTSRIKKNYTRNYPGFDINQVPSGVLFEDKMLSVGPNSITPIIGDKGTKVRKVANIVKGSDFDRLPNKRFNNGGITSKLNKKQIQELVEQGYVIEEQ